MTEVFGMAGLEVAVLDVDIFALQNAVELNIKSAEEKLIGIVKVGGKNSTISIVRNGVNLFTSDVGTGGRSITEVISTETGASFEEAEKIKRKLCLEKDGSGSEEEAYLDALHKGVEYVAQEIHKQFNYLLSAVDSGELSVVYASGGGVQSKGLLSALSERLGVPVEQFNPFSVIEINEELHDLNYVKELSPFMGTAVGLAIREVGDKVKAEDFVE
ncbi:MAG: hypothetical protein D6780_04020 [Candidatus Dadabacteria bacterium]|nr:MAG: hypothetical protein D6780_04020 [Candidatus Dadabacteria bacterium]